VRALITNEETVKMALVVPLILAHHLAAPAVTDAGGQVSADNPSHEPAQLSVRFAIPPLGPSACGIPVLQAFSKGRWARAVEWWRQCLGDQVPLAIRWFALPKRRMRWLMAGLGADRLRW
jgi:hypothetical protein